MSNWSTDAEDVHASVAALRQAMIAGMSHFASQSGTTLIAEGIETESEAAMLRQLGVPLGEAGMLGQGYLFGKPTMFP